uniref:Uncharacterized protein n=1 Tax=viral metagenome TaxID=1070528 RepID=A0A6C0HHQ2_9ZZZZ
MEPQIEENITEKYPNLHFGEITVQYEEHWIHQTMRYFNYETEIDASTNVIILYHDTNDIMSLNDVAHDKNILYPDSHCIIPYSINICSDLSKKIKLYNRIPIMINGKMTLSGVVDIYNTKYKTYVLDPSKYNCIYYVIDTHYKDLERVVFSILKRKYGIDSCRFLFSYDPEFITKSQAANIIRKILYKQ